MTQPYTPYNQPYGQQPQQPQQPDQNWTPPNFANFDPKNPPAGWGVGSLDPDDARVEVVDETEAVLEKLWWQYTSYIGLDGRARMDRMGNVARTLALHVTYKLPSGESHDREWYSNGQPSKALILEAGKVLIAEDGKAIAEGSNSQLWFKHLVLGGFPKEILLFNHLGRIEGTRVYLRRVPAPERNIPQSLAVSATAIMSGGGTGQGNRPRLGILVPIAVLALPDGRVIGQAPSRQARTSTPTSAPSAPSAPSANPSPLAPPIAPAAVASPPWVASVPAVTTPSQADGFEPRSFLKQKLVGLVTSSRTQGMKQIARGQLAATLYSDSTLQAPDAPTQQKMNALLSIIGDQTFFTQMAQEGVIAGYDGLNMSI